MEDWKTGGGERKKVLERPKRFWVFLRVSKRRTTRYKGRYKMEEDDEEEEGGLFWEARLQSLGEYNVRSKTR